MKVKLYLCVTVQNASAVGVSVATEKESNAVQLFIA